MSNTSLLSQDGSRGLDKLDQRDERVLEDGSRGLDKLDQRDGRVLENSSTGTLARVGTASTASS